MQQIVPMEIKPGQRERAQTLAVKLVEILRREGDWNAHIDWDWGTSEQFAVVFDSTKVRQR